MTDTTEMMLEIALRAIISQHTSQFGTDAYKAAQDAYRLGKVSNEIPVLRETFGRKPYAD